MKTALPLAALVSLVACNHPGYVSEFQQPVFDVKDAVFVPVRGDDGRVIAADLLIADKPNLCEAMESGFMPSQMESVHFRVIDFVADNFLGEPLANKYEIIVGQPKSYGTFAWGTHDSTDIACKQMLQPDIAVFPDGDVTIDHLQERQMVDGTFHTYLGSLAQGTARAGPEGRFHAQWCETAFAKFSCR